MQQSELWMVVTDIIKIIKPKAHLMTLFLVSFASKLVQTWSHSEYMKIQEKLTIAWILSRNRRCRRCSSRSNSLDAKGAKKSVNNWASKLQKVVQM